MSLARRLVRAALVFVGASVAMLVIAAQLAPGWTPATDQAALDPQPEPQPSTGSASAPLQRVPAELTHDDDQTARAWLVTPERAVGDPPVPGVVLVHGAGGADRDALLSQAQTLAHAGVAAIVYDKRSEGYSLVSRDYTRLADDAITAADLLAVQPGIDAARIGIMGFSEGGWVAPIAAERAPDRFAFVVLASATIVSPVNEVAWAVDYRLSGTPHWLRRIPATALTAGRPVVDYLDTDINPTLEALTVPIYAVWGADDTSIPVAVAARTLTRHVDTPVTTRILTGAGHGLGDGEWLVGTAAWITGLPGSSVEEITGTEPSSSLGLASLPRPVWYLNPFGHAALALTLAVGSCFLPRRRAAPDKRSTTTLRPT